jgi:hypothetical protein
VDSDEYGSPLVGDCEYGEELMSPRKRHADHLNRLCTS